MRYLGFLVFNSYKIEETCFLCSVEYFKSTGEYILCGNKSNDNNDNISYMF